MREERASSRRNPWYNVIDFEVMACEVLGGLTVDNDRDELIAACADRDARCVEFLNARDVRFRRGFLA